MSATERLRKLLNERGVKYDADDTTLSDGDVSQVTYWQSRGIEWSTDGRDEYLAFDAVQLITPEEAITATLGSGTCHLVPYNENYATCSECGISLPRTHGGWWFYCPGCGRHLMGEKVVDE